MILVINKYFLRRQTVYVIRKLFVSVFFSSHLFFGLLSSF